MAATSSSFGITLRGTARDFDLEAMLGKRLEANQLRLPPYPAIAMKLKQLAERTRTSTQDISATISVDAALVAAVLRRANAAAEGAHVFSLEAAIARLGVEQIVRIAIAQSLGNVANSAGPLRVLRRDVWRRSLLAAKIAAQLAPPRGVDADAAFVAGLLHDFGAITVLVGLEDLRLELPMLSAALWRQFVDRLQPRFGRVFAERWSLPAPIADAIEYCATPRNYAGPHRTLVQLIGAVVAMIALLDDAPGDGLSALHRVKGLRADELERVRAFVPQIADLMATFEPPPGADVSSASAVEPPATEARWPIDVVVSSKSETYLANAMSANAIVFVGAQPLTQNWLAQLVVHCDPRFDLLANVATCTQQPQGTYEIVARPFALAGADKQAWMSLIQRTRPHG